LNEHCAIVQAMQDLYIIKLPTANGLVFKINNRYSNEGSLKRHNKNTVAEYFQIYTNPFDSAIKLPF